MARVQQQGIEDTRIDYYDILIIGKTGQGKSTTADKLLVANPTGEDYSGLQFVEQHDAQNKQLKVDDITMWCLSELGKSEDSKKKFESAETRLKFLSFCRTKENPHELVNKTRNHDPSAGPQTLGSTRECEVISNDTSEVRVLDVPGFFDGEDIKSPTSSAPPSKLEESVTNVQDNNLGIMRKILHLQTAFRMKFRRILYFLPVRGPLERVDAILKWDLQVMAHYFGSSILQSMVIIATISAHISELPIEDSQKFPQKQIDNTKVLFKQAINDIFPRPPTEEDIQVPPIVFISLTDTCETILKKVKEAYENDDGLQLEFNPHVCADCGVKVGEVKGVKVACCIGEDWSVAIPYSESTCHPIIVPKYTRLQKIIGGIAYVVSAGWARGKKWPVFEGEVCGGCRQEPGTSGCKKVGQKFKAPKEGEKIVDHTNKVTEVILEDGSGTATENDTQENPEAEENIVQVNRHYEGRSHPTLVPTSSYNSQNEEQKG